MVNLEVAGVPGVYVATVEFEEAGLHQARALGANPAAVFVSHPIQDRSDEEMVAIADGALEALLAKLQHNGS